MELTDHIKRHGLDSLTKSPYNFVLKYDVEYPLVTINYTGSPSVDAPPIFRQAKGTIVDISNMSDPKLICLPFMPFYSLDQLSKHTLELDSLEVLHKEDGTLIKYYFHPYRHRWCAASRNLARIIGKLAETWEYALQANIAKGFDPAALDTTKIYLFELVGPDNRILVNYPETKIFHIGTRCMRTLQEVDIDIGIPKPCKYNIGKVTSINRLKRLIGDLVGDFYAKDREGVILTDKHFNRVKVQSPNYLLYYQVRGDKYQEELLCLRNIILNTPEEFLATLPAMRATYTKYAEALERLISVWNMNHMKLMYEGGKTDKMFAMTVNQYIDELFLVNFHYMVRRSHYLCLRQELQKNIDNTRLLKQLHRVLKKFLSADRKSVV